MADNGFWERMMETAWHTRVSWFRTFNRQAAPGGTVLVGDSLTQEFPLHELMALQGDQRLFTVHNRGIGGDTTNGVLRRMAESIWDLAPGKVFLLIGTNDLNNAHAAPADIARNIRGIIEQTHARCPQTLFTVLSLYPVNARADEGMDIFAVGSRTNERIRAVNAALERMAVKTGASYLDLHSLLTDEHGNLRRAYTREGLHLSPEGYIVVYEALSPLL
jgi:lysophospholipase L1-like esterase